MYWYLKGLRNYAVFSGRAQRAEYWMFGLFYIIFAIVLIIIESILGIGEEGGGLLSGLYFLAMLIPIFAVFFRRLHDTDHSGWWFLMGLVPVFGVIILLIFMVLDSDAGENRYGPNPKATPA